MKVTYTVHNEALFGGLKNDDLADIDQDASLEACADIVREALAASLPNDDVTVRVARRGEARGLRDARVESTYDDDGSALVALCESITDFVACERADEWLVREDRARVGVTP